MSFGWSVGDIALAIKAIVKVGKAVRESGGAASEYQETVTFLNSIEKTLKGLETLLHEHPNLRWEAGLIEQGDNLKSAIGEFRGKIEKYERSLGEDTERKKVRRVPREVQFAAFVSDRMKQLRVQVTQPQVVLDNFIALQMLTSILDLSRDLSSSQENFKCWSERIAPVISSLQGSLEERNEETLVHFQGIRNQQQELMARFGESLNEVHTQLLDLEASQQVSVDQESARTNEVLNSQFEIRQSVQALHDRTRAILGLIQQHQNSEREYERVGPGSWHVALSVFQVVGSGVASGFGAMAAISSKMTSWEGEKEHHPILNHLQVGPSPVPRYEDAWENAFKTAEEQFSNSDEKHCLKNSETSLKNLGGSKIIESYSPLRESRPALSTVDGDPQATLRARSPPKSAKCTQSLKFKRVFDRDLKTVTDQELASWENQINKGLIIDSSMGNKDQSLQTGDNLLSISTGYNRIDLEKRRDFFHPGRVFQTQEVCWQVFIDRKELKEKTVKIRGLVIVDGETGRGWRCLIIRELESKAPPFSWADEAAIISTQTLPPYYRPPEIFGIRTIEVIKEGNDPSQHLNVCCFVALSPRQIVWEDDLMMNIGVIHDWEPSPLREAYLKSSMQPRKTFGKEKLRRH